jgi:hypothetical protein
MHPKEALSRSLKWFADHLLNAILSLIVTAAIAAWGGIFGFSISAIDYTILLLSKPTPLWATICLILLCGLYTILKIRQYQNSYKPPAIQEELREEFGAYWNNQYKLRCLKCKWPLKCASKRHDPSIFFCSNCDTKHSLRNKCGVHLTEAQAIEELKKLPTNGST